jgi:hypothetical protein
MARGRLLGNEVATTADWGCATPHLRPLNRWETGYGYQSWGHRSEFEFEEKASGV